MLESSIVTNEEVHGVIIEIIEPDCRPGVNILADLNRVQRLFNGCENFDTH